MTSAYTRPKVPSSVLQTVGVVQERLCKGRDGGIQYMQLLDVPLAFVLFCRVIFTFANKIEAIHEKSLVNAKLEPRSIARLSSVLFILPLFHLGD